MRLGIFLLTCFIYSCNTLGDSNIGAPLSEPVPEWSIPIENIFDGGVGKDGIPSIDAPKFGPLDIVNPAFDDELVLGISIHGEYRAYPVPILDWHEIVNDRFGNNEISITYCPLTGTGIGWQLPLSNGGAYGVSGLLFNNNLMPYDRRTNSTWSQIKRQCVSGLLQERMPITISLIETSFSTWKKSFPASVIMNANTGFDRRYSIYPYGDYRSNQDRLFFPVQRTDDRIPKKERVRGVIINEQVKVYRFEPPDSGIAVYGDQFQGRELVVCMSTRDNFIVVFYNDQKDKFSPREHAFPIVMTDSSGTGYDISGRAVTGPAKGTFLDAPESMMGYWFSWPAFFDDIEIFTN